MKAEDSNSQEARTWEVLACLGVASRFRLVKALAQAERCVGELAAMVGLSQSCTTRHLQALERLGVIEGRREGKRVRFRLRGEVPSVGGLLSWALTTADAGPLRLPASQGQGIPGAEAGGTNARAPRIETSRKRRAVRHRLDANLSGGHDAPGDHLESIPDDGATGGRRGEAARSRQPREERGDLEDYLL